MQGHGETDGWKEFGISGSGVRPAALPKAPLMILPALDMCGPDVRLCSDVVSVTDPMGDYGNQTLLSDASISSAAASLAP